MSSLRNIRRAARLLRTVERFVSIDMHPSVYISFVAINLCLVFVYRELTLPVASLHHESVVATPASTSPPKKNKLASSLLPGDRGELPSMIQAMVKPVSERQKDEAIIAKIESQSEKASTVTAPSVKPVQAKSSGAALAAVPEKIEKPRKKTKRIGRGLVPPPPPGVFVVPPPPDAPSLYSHLDTGSFMVAAPPPMVLDDSFSVSSQTRTHKGSVHNYGKRFGNERSKTVRNGNIQQVIVSR